MSAGHLDLPTGRRGQILAVVLPIVLLAALWFGAAVPAIDWYAERAETLARQRTLAARMADLAAALPALQTQLDASAKAPAPTVALLDGTTDGIAGAALQGRVQELASAAGANLTSIETLTPEPAGSARRVGVRVSLTAPWPVLVHLLEQLAEGPPRMVADDLQLHSALVIRRSEVSPIDVSLSVYAFRAAAPAGK